ncbi:hypothetical protein niasHT_026677 [Heterodera trifolii]|uniref:Carboxylic ester hydrolase n=1 Tax=Heterodera trifolii TaxID=157864 RepID=A0ABD2JT47_9BILA
MVDIAATKNMSTIDPSALSNYSIWHSIYTHTEHAFSQLFSLLGHDWVKGRPCVHGTIGHTKNGPIRGKTFILQPKNDAGERRRVNTFLGIPFARAGTYNDRFKKAFPVEAWKEPLDCTRFGPRAVQPDMFWDTYITPIGQDEATCLNLNVFAPDWESAEFKKTGRPVMVYVHGGGYLIHSSANYGDWNICQNLCLYDVVVCVIQYRLGAMGFFSTGDARCPGNFGLWDQLAALRWVKENISFFGGDPENVTLFGQSAGAACIDLLSLSPMAKGLFKRIILMGGNACTDWSMATPERTQQAAIRMARKGGWKGADTDLDSLLTFMRSVPAYKISAPLIGKSAFNRHKKGLDFCPVIDGELITKSPEQMRRELDWPVEVIVGGTESEALLFAALGRRQANVVSMRKYLQIYIPSTIAGAEQLREQCIALYVHTHNSNGIVPSGPGEEEAAEHHHQPQQQQMARAFLKMHSDLMMNNAVQRYCRGMFGAETPPNHRIYLYNMMHYNRDGFGIVGLRMPFFAATHCHDARYLLGKGLYAKFRPNWDDKQMMRIIGGFFTNFAKYGNPNTHWAQKNNMNSVITTTNDTAPSADGQHQLHENDGDNDQCQQPQQQPWHNEHCANSTLVSPDFWRPISAQNTEQHMELTLEPTARTVYHGGRYGRFWHKVDNEMAKLQLLK